MLADREEIIRAATVEDASAVALLFREAFGHERDPSVWLWKYFGGDPRSVSYICVAGDRVVAHCGGTAVTICDRSQTYPGFQSVDFMSSPSYPGGVGRGGVFVRTVKRFFAERCGTGGVPFVYGFPGERHRLLGERLLGYEAIEAVSEFTSQQDVPQQELESLAEEHLSIFSNRSFEFGAERSVEYLRWRYLRRPNSDYKFVRPRGWFGGADIAAIVRQVDGISYLMEIGGKLSRKNMRRLSGLLREACGRVTGWFPAESSVGSGLHSAGFERKTRDHLLESRSFVGAVAPRPGEFYYSLGDYDVY